MFLPIKHTQFLLQSLTGFRRFFFIKVMTLNIALRGGGENSVGGSSDFFLVQTSVLSSIYVKALTRMTMV